MTGPEVIWNDEGWVLTLEGYRGLTEMYTYRLSPPKWSVQFDVARNGVPGGQTLTVRANAERMERALIEAILDDPRVRKVNQERLASAEMDGYMRRMMEGFDQREYTFKH